MGYYEYAWDERKSFLLSSMLIGGILALIVTGLIGYFVFSMPDEIWQFSLYDDILGLTIIAITSFILFSTVVAVGRLVFTESSIGGGFVTDFLNGLWLTIISLITGGVIGLIVGLFICVIFFWLFSIVVTGYIVYLPVSSIYLYVKYKKEVSQKKQSV